MQLTRGVRARHIGLLAAVLVVAILVSACGGSSGSTSSTTSPTTKNTSPQTSGSAAQVAAKKIVTQYLNGYPSVTATGLSKAPPAGIKVAGVVCTVPTCQANAEAGAYKALGWHYQAYPYDVGQGPPALAKAFTAAIASHPKYIVLMAVFPQATFQAQLKQALNAGIGVVLFASGSGAIPGTIGCTACQPEQFKTGEVQAASVIADGAKSGEIAYASDPTTAVLSDEYDGAKHEVASLLNGASLPLIQIAQADTPSQNTNTVINYLQRNQAIKYVIFPVESLASGVPQALSQDGLSSVKIVTQAPAPTDLQEIAAGTQFASVASPDAYAVWNAADLLARKATGTPTTASERTPIGWHRIINKSNVASVEGTDVQPSGYQATYKKAWQVK